MAGPAVAMAVRKARQRIVDHFTTADATAPERATGYDPDSGRRLQRRMFRRMRDHGVIRETKPGRFYLDRDALAEFRSAMRTRALGMMALGGVAMAAIVAFAS